MLEKKKITTRFYQLMFGAHPELLNIFNHANQKQRKQQKALASAVYAAAKYIDNLCAILPVVNQIAHKHVMKRDGVKPSIFPTYFLTEISAIIDVFLTFVPLKG